MNPVLKAEIDQYVGLHVPPSTFIRSVLENDLRGTVSAMRWERPQPDLSAIVLYCHYEIPAECWGSQEAVRDWIRKGEAGAIAAKIQKAIVEAIG